DSAFIFSGRFKVKNAISFSVENSISLYSILFGLLLKQKNDNLRQKFDVFCPFYKTGFLLIFITI
ncbi:MAG: hypothetical protein KJO26_10165, partial [Deltaproteobacteria bacterium]|nr:hypothetical protein [Deltaproteobacteria bacterium]